MAIIALALTPPLLWQQVNREFSFCHLSENNFPHHMSLWLSFALYLFLSSFVPAVLRSTGESHKLQGDVLHEEAFFCSCCKHFHQHRSKSGKQSTAGMNNTIAVLIQKSTVLITCQKYCSIIKTEFSLFIFDKILQVQSYRFTEETIKIWTKQI